MIEKVLKINNKYGIHARPAALIVKEASKFSSEIFFVKNDNKVSCRSIMELMAIEGFPGTEIKMVVDGEDESAAARAIEELFDNKFNESNIE
tara:strand:- start:589 stop:864 length:276 start_codon:yes stop_codon:yes gene_type:complete